MNMYTGQRIDFGNLKGLVFKKVWQDNDEGQDVINFMTDTDLYVMTHLQDCCENVFIESIDGELSDLVDTPILMAEESCDTGDCNDHGAYGDSYTYTFYKLATIKGYVDIRWYGTSNGYYSERVDLIKFKDWKINETD